jgi:cytochrome c biogenesis protein CcmG/thiol:disulfide interchange protein DsbE
VDAPPPSSIPHPSALEAGRRRGRNRWLAVGGVLTAVAILTLLLAFGLSRDPTAIRSPLIGKAAPAFTLRTLDGGEVVKLSDFRRRVVVVNFWASWCAECRVEHDDLAAAWDRYRDQRVVLVGIAFQDRTSASLAYLGELGGDWPQLSDPGDQTALAYGVYGVPETFVVGPDGRVVGKQVGAVSYAWLTTEVDRLLTQVTP